jgi:predicted TIM-barrel fold metal-dependent hydrolase
VDTFGAERIVFGSDFPICNPAMFIGGVMLETLITDRDKEKIFSLNAKRILQGGI